MNAEEREEAQLAVDVGLHAAERAQRRRYLNLWLDNLGPLGGPAAIHPPRSPSGYAHFAGHIYAVDRPAPLAFDAAQAKAYYEQQGLPVADVEAYDDDHGIVLVGETVCLDVDVGGDWRRVDDALELIAVYLR